MRVEKGLHAKLLPNVISKHSIIKKAKNINAMHVEKGLYAKSLPNVMLKHSICKNVKIIIAMHVEKGLYAKSLANVISKHSISKKVKIINAMRVEKVFHVKSLQQKKGEVAKGSEPKNKKRKTKVSKVPDFLDQSESDYEEYLKKYSLNKKK